MKLTIHGKTYTFGEMLVGQDELLAPILTDLLDEKPELVKAVSAALSAGIKTAGGKVDISVAAMIAKLSDSFMDRTIDLVKLVLWAVGQKKLSKIMAIALIPEGQEFDPDRVPELEKEMIHATRKDGLAVFAAFFAKSADSAGSTPNSSAAAPEATQS